MAEEEEELLVFNYVWPKGEHAEPHTFSEITWKECLVNCLDNKYCVAVHYYPDPKLNNKHACIFYKASSSNGLTTILKKGISVSLFFILPDNLDYYEETLKLKNAKIKVSYKTTNRSTMYNEQECWNSCKNDEKCSVYTFRKYAPHGSVNCYTYNRENIKCMKVPERVGETKTDCNILEERNDYVTVFM